MSSRNPSNMLAESIADFSKSAYQAVSGKHICFIDYHLNRCIQFTEVQSQARQEIAQAVAQTQEVRAERDKAMRDLRTLQLESQSLKEDAALSKAAVRAFIGSRFHTETTNFCYHIVFPSGTNSALYHIIFCPFADYFYYADRSSSRDSCQPT